MLKMRITSIATPNAGDQDASRHQPWKKSRHRIVAAVSLARRLLRQVVHVVDHGDEEIEEQLATVLHLILHGAAPFEGVSCSDDESKVMSSKFGVIIGSVGVCEASRCQDGGALDSRLETLFLESELFELLKAVLLGLAVNNRVFQDWSGRRLDYGFRAPVAIAAIFKVPAITLLVILHARIVIALIQILKDR